jgi:ParB family chromosome partitioning protein
MEHRALGKGLSALIPDKLDLSGDNRESISVSFVKIDQVRDNQIQPRMNYNSEKLEDLKASIKEKGVLQPILVREVSDGYEVIAGERRLRAARELSLQEVPVIIRKVSTQEAFVLALIENIQREELNAIEEAKAFERLVLEFGLTQEDVAQSVGKKRSTISNTLRLLKLPQEIQDAVFSGEVSMGHARTLLSIEDPEEQKRIFAKIRESGISVRELENIAKNQKVKPLRYAKRNKPRNPEVVLLEEELQRILGTKVRVHSQKKRGKIVIEYYSPDDLERLLQIIKQ